VCPCKIGQFLAGPANGLAGRSNVSVYTCEDEI
jgi:hypothetical protein